MALIRFHRNGVYVKVGSRLRKDWFMQSRQKRYEPDLVEPRIRLDNRQHFAERRLLSLLFTAYKRTPAVDEHSSTLKRHWKNHRRRAEGFPRP